MTTVLIGDTQRLFSQSLSISLGLRPGFEVVPERPRSGPECVDMAEELNPDVAVLDYWMPQMGGAAATAMIRKTHGNTKVLLLSWFHGPTELQNALAAGAAGFLPKSLHVDDVAGAIRRVTEGQIPVYPSEMERLVDKRKVAEATKVWERLASLTRREHQVLQLLGFGHSSADIASGLGTQPSTVRTQINRILGKLGARTQMEALGIARHYDLIHP